MVEKKRVPIGGVALFAKAVENQLLEKKRVPIGAVENQKKGVPENYLQVFPTKERPVC